MCTVSWLQGEDGASYDLFCNRDEKHTRARAAAPRIGWKDGVRFVAPIDGDFGGTWIAANETGLTVCLLNGTPAASRLPVSHSRGLLLLDLAGASSAEAVCDRIEAADLSPYAPFTLVAVEPGRTAAVADWDGIEKSIAPGADTYSPLISSSVETALVRERRREQFPRPAVRNRQSLREFHHSHAGGPSAYSTCMHRADAATVSFSWVHVTPAGVEFSYRPGAPCQNVPEQTCRLARNQ